MSRAGTNMLTRFIACTLAACALLAEAICDDGSRTP